VAIAAATAVATIIAGPELVASRPELVAPDSDSSLLTVWHDSMFLKSFSSLLAILELKGSTSGSKDRSRRSHRGAWQAGFMCQAETTVLARIAFSHTEAQKCCPG